MIPENPAVLVVDDQEGVRKLLHEVLRRRGYTPLLARNGLEAEELARRTRPVLTLVDMNMPGAGGLETMKLLKKIHPDMPVIIMTAVLPMSDEEARAQGACCTVLKPFDVRALASLVDSVVAGGSPGMAAESRPPYPADEGEEG